jgi:TatD DNase family protein
MLIDAHAHLDRYTDEDLELALEEIRRDRILTVSTAMDLPSYQRALAIAGRCEWILPTFGVHPWNAPAYAHRLAELDEAIAASPMLGEIGLDHFFVEDPAHYPAQREVLAFFLAAARAQDKVVNLHTKGAEAEVLALLDHYEVRRAIVHWYSGPLDVLHGLIARGLYFTMGVEVLYSDQIRAIARAVPAGQLLTETDNPGGPKGFLGRLGMPGLIRDVVGALAALRGTTPGAVEEMVEANFTRLVGDELSPMLSTSR